MFRHGFMILIGLLLAAAAHAQTLADFPNVTSHGHAEIDVAPDKATLFFSVRAEDGSSAVAVTRVETAISQALAVLAQYKIAEDAVSASDLRKGERYRDPHMQAGMAPTYFVDRDLTVRLDGLENFAAIFKALASIDALVDLRADFDVEDREALEAELLMKAGKDARRRAEQMAASLGKKIKDVYAISPDGGFMHGMGGDRGMAEMLYAKSEPSTFVMLPKTVKVSQRVHAVFSLR